MAPQANPTTPPRRPREPSPSAPGDNKRQSRRLKAGQQALAGLTLGSLPVSASDTPEAGTLTQRTGEVEELGGGTLPLDPWAHQGVEISDRDKVMYQMAFKQRPLRDGGGKPSLGRLAPWARPLSKAAALGAKICVLTSPWGGQAPGVALVGGWVASLPGGPAGGHQGDSGAGGRPTSGRPTFLDILHSVALNIQDPDRQFLRWSGWRSCCGSSSTRLSSSTPPRRCTGSMSRSMWRSTLGLSRMGIQSGGLQLWRCWARSSSVT